MKRYKNLTGTTIFVNDLGQWEIPPNAVIDVDEIPQSLHINQLIAMNYLVSDRTNTPVIHPPMEQSTTTPIIDRDSLRDIVAEVVKSMSGPVDRLAEIVSQLQARGISLGDLSVPNEQKTPTSTPAEYEEKLANSRVKMVSKAIEHNKQTASVEAPTEEDDQEAEDVAELTESLQKLLKMSK